MGNLIRVRVGNQALGQLVLADQPVLFRRGQLLEVADQLRNEVLVAHAPIETLHAHATYGVDIAEEDVTGLAAHTESYLTSNVDPSLQAHLNEGNEVHGDGRLSVAAGGDMPPPPLPTGEPPHFTDDGIIFDPNDLGPVPSFPIPGPRGPRGPGIPQSVPGVVTQQSGTSTPPSGATDQGPDRGRRYTEGG